MTITLPIETLFILHTLRKSGFDAYIVGGAVRDVLLARLTNNAVTKPKDQLQTDYDFTTNALPEEITQLFPNSFYENQFGTVSITPKHIREMMGVSVESSTAPVSEESSSAKVIELEKATKIHVSLKEATGASLPQHSPLPGTAVEKNYEITTYRSDGTYEDHRRPESVTWGKTIQDDLSRRDFTINAMALQVHDDVLRDVLGSFSVEQLHQNQAITLQPTQYTLIDLFDGVTDLHNSVIRPVGDPVTRFHEDALRMLRAIRFSVQLNMQVTDETFQALQSLAQDIEHVSWERIRDEFLKMLASNYPAEAIELLDQSGLLTYLLPELLEGKGVKQGGHHTTDVWTHSIDALASCPSKDPIVRFATLIHDIAKPRTFKLINNQPTFYNHELVGAKMAKQIANRFRLSRQNIDRVFLLVRHHMFYYQPTHTDAAIRRFMRKVGLQNINDILDLREGDRLGSGARKTSWRLEEMKQRMVEQLHQPFAITDLKINGTEVMENFGLKPGPIIGKVLNTLFEKVVDQPELNVKETLLAEAKQIIEQT